MNMQTRFVTTGNLNDDKRVFLAYELDEDAFKINLYVIDKKIISKEQLDLLQSEWVTGKSFEFPEGTEKIFPDINNESILPDHIKSEKTAEIRYMQNEWAIQLLTHKLWESHLIELEGLKKKAESVVTYDRNLFDDAKSFWERVLEHKKERNLSQQKLDNIKEEINTIFEKLKSLRKSESVEFDKNSKIVLEHILERLNDIKSRANEKANFKSLSEEIKELQRENRNQRVSKVDEVNIRKAYDDAFLHIGEQRSKFFNNKFESRIAGLNEVIRKMETGLKWDKQDLETFSKKMDNPRLQSLELQLLKVRLRQLKEVITSKEDKLNDIYKTLESIKKQSSGTKETKTEKPTAKVEAKPVELKTEITKPVKEVVETLEEVKNEIAEEKTTENLIEKEEVKSTEIEATPEMAKAEAMETAAEVAVEKEEEKVTE